MTRARGCGLLVLTMLMISACNQTALGSAQSSNTAGDVEQAGEALIAYFETLHDGEWMEAVQYYGGEYEILVSINPSVDSQDMETLFRNACTINGFQCLQVRDIVLMENPEPGLYRFAVEFSNEDGSLFVRGPCCESDPENQPPASQFVITVFKGTGGQFLVADLPVYVP